MKARDACLLMLLAGRHYGYYHVPQALQAGFFAALASVLLIVFIAGSGLPRPLAAWAMGEEAMCAGCTAAWMAWPWQAGDELCSDQLGFKLGAIGVFWLALALWAHNRTGVQVTRGDK